MIEIIKVAIENLKTNKIRSFLTMLGVVIGVYSVVVLVAVGTGIESFVTTRFNALGSNLILISPGVFDFADDPAKALSNNQLDEKHVDLIDTYVGDLITGVTPSVRSQEIVKYKTNTFLSMMIGANEQAANIFDFEIEEGRFFSSREVRANAKVAIIGSRVAEELYPSQSPLGNQITIIDERFEVIGIMKEKGQNFDNRVIMPYTAAMDILDVDKFTNIGMKAKDIDKIDFTMKQVELALLRDLDEDDFTVLSQQDILGSIQNILGIITMGVGALAGISLIVGGIGIMNIMLVSVTERIKEIGLRKALGATSFQVGVQFMMEATFISLIGGGIGLALGWLSTVAAKSFFEAIIPLWAVAMSFGFSALVGIVFGTYPAYQASKKDPIEALRYE